MSNSYPRPPLQPGDQSQQPSGDDGRYTPAAGTPGSQPSYPQQPPYYNPSAPQPFNPQQPPVVGSPPSHPYYPQRAPFAGAPPSQPFYPQQPSGMTHGFASNPAGASPGYVQTNLADYWKHARGGKRNISILAAILVLLFSCSAIASATSSTAGTDAGLTSSQNNQGSSASTQQTQAPTPTPTPTPTLKPTPVPTQSPAQYKASATRVTVADIAKDPSSYKGKTVDFTATIVDFVQNSSGVTAGANVADPNDYSSFVQIIFSPGFSVKGVNKYDTVQVWGPGLGSFTGQNAYGGTIQEAGVQELYLYDSTTGYSDNSVKDPAAAAASAIATYG